MTVGDAMWRNQPDRLAKAQDQARIACYNRDYSSAHSIMLSAYVTILGGQPVEGNRSVKFTLFALWHALCLLRRWRKLDHNQLDVLVQFLLKLRSRLPFVKAGRPYRWYKWHSLLDRKIIMLAGKEVGLAMVGGVKPHQTALAYMTYAEAEYAADFTTQLWNTSNVQLAIDQALTLDEPIRREQDQPIGLRQLVRIYRKAGALYAKDEISPSNKQTAIRYLNKALKLAQVEADVPDQVPKILAELRNL